MRNRSLIQMAAVFSYFCHMWSYWLLFFLQATNQRSLDLRTHVRNFSMMVTRAALRSYILHSYSIQQIRRQSTAELKTFKARWNKAVSEDKEWIDFPVFARRKGWHIWYEWPSYFVPLSDTMTTSVGKLILEVILL